LKMAEEGEKKTPLQEAFEQIDEDNSGTLDREEVRSLVEMAGKTFSEAELDDAMKELDPSGDGQVDFDEFKAYWEDNIVAGGGLLKGIMATFNLLEEVKEIDAAGEEKTVAYNPDRYIDDDDDFRARVFALFAMIDKDHDLCITTTEFSKYLKNLQPPVDEPALLAESFLKYDTNGNGTIDRDELAGVVRGLGLLDIVPDQEAAAVYMMKLKKLEFRKKKQQNPAVYGHQVWNKRYEFPDLKEGKGLEEEEVDKFKELFAMGDPQHIGYLGHRQFKDLLKMLNIEVDEEELQEMFLEMDENDDGQIEFDEFVPTMVRHIKPDDLDVMDQVRVGGQGTRMWGRGEILWAANTGLILTSGGVILAGLIYFHFMLVPLTISYFCVFLFGPIMDFFNHKLGLGPGIGVLGTLVVVFAGFAAVAVLVSIELGAVFGDPDFMEKLNGMVDDVYAELNASGVKVLREQDTRYTEAELSALIGSFGDFFNQFALIFLLTLYILAEKVEKKMFGDGEGIMQEIESMTTGYIGLKTALSALTGAIVAVILLALQVKLAVMFGLLSFLLNYIPNVGSIIAMFLPMPIVLVDDNLALWQKVMAFVGPGAVQGYVGNALEPIMFGKLLNMTPMSILFALVLWSAMWGLLGAVLSVPLLGIQKICCNYANHPIAKIMLAMIREDATVDEAAEAKKKLGETDDDAKAEGDAAQPAGDAVAKKEEGGEDE